MEQEVIEDIVAKYEDGMEANEINANLDNLYASSDDSDENEVI